MNWRKTNTANVNKAVTSAITQNSRFVWTLPDDHIKASHLPDGHIRHHIKASHLPDGHIRHQTKASHLPNGHIRHHIKASHLPDGQIRHQVKASHLPFGHFRHHIRASHSPNKSTSKLIREYVRETSFHGLKYIFYEGSSVTDRLLWLLVFLASLGCTVALCSSMVANYLSGPTTTVVKDTHYPLYLFPFPGVSICPTDKIKRKTAFTYIYQKLNITNGELNNNSVDQFLSAMYFFKHPRYSSMQEYLNKCQDILPQLATLNLTDFMLECRNNDPWSNSWIVTFMILISTLAASSDVICKILHCTQLNVELSNPRMGLKVLPSCKEMFRECYWHGIPENCCDLFHKQRSEEGFCYSFNTYTSQDVRSCEDITYTSTKHKDFEGSQTPRNCMLRRNSASGTTTGLEVFLNRFDSSQRLANYTTIIGDSGVMVQLHTSDEYPESGMGVMVPASPGIRVTTSIKAYITESLPPVRTLPISQRHCYFPDEIELGLAAQYSQRSCYIECRLDYFHQACGCRPYYFNMLDNRVPVCNTLQLRCIAEHGENVKFFRPPVDSEHRGFTLPEMQHSLECSHCLPTCLESYYVDDEDITIDTQPRAQNSFGYLDLNYKSGGAVYYERDVTFGWKELLVAIGGTAGLFLGISLLSVVELLYWMVKVSYVSLKCSQFVKSSSKSKLPKGQVHYRDFY